MDSASAVSVPSPASAHGTHPSTPPSTHEGFGLSSIRHYLQGVFSFTRNPVTNQENTTSLQRRRFYSTSTASLPSSRALSPTTSSRLGADFQQDSEAPTLTTPAEVDPVILEIGQGFMKGYQPTPDVLEDPLISGKVSEIVVGFESSTMNSRQRAAAEPLSRKGLMAAAALKSASKGVSIERAIKMVQPKRKEAVTDKQHEEATQALFIKKAKLAWGELNLARKLHIDPSHIETLRRMPFEEMTKTLTSPENCYSVAYGSSELKDGDIVEGSLEYRENGIGHYDIDCKNNPIFEPFRYLIKQFKTEPTLSIHDQMNLLSIFLNRGLKTPEYSCPSLQAVQSISRDLGRLSIAEYAQVGTADCRPHSMILACLAGLAGIKATYSNFEIEHHGETQRSTKENHSVVTYRDESGKAFIADSYFTQLHGIALEELAKGVILPDTKVYVRFIQPNSFPRILRAPSPGELADCTAEPQNTGETTQHSASAISHRREPTPPSVTQINTPPQAKSRSHRPATKGVSAHPTSTPK